MFADNMKWIWLADHALFSIENSDIKLIACLILLEMVKWLKKLSPLVKLIMHCIYILSIYIFLNDVKIYKNRIYFLIPAIEYAPIIKKFNSSWKWLDDKTVFFVHVSFLFFELVHLREKLTIVKGRE